MTPAVIARLTPAGSAPLAVGLFVLAVVVRRSSLVLGPIVLPAPALRRRDRRARPTASSAFAASPRRRRSSAGRSRSMKERDGRRFSSRTPRRISPAPSSPISCAARSRTTAVASPRRQNPGSRDDGGFRQLTRERPVLRDDAGLAKVLNALDTQVPYLVVDNLSIRPLNAFRGFKPAAGPGAGEQRAARRIRAGLSRAARGRPPRPK